MEDEFAEHLQKRIRNLQKRERKLESYREQPVDTLDEHQRAALAAKEGAVDAPLRDLRDLLAMYEREIARKAEAEKIKLEAAVKEAEQRVIERLKGNVYVPVSGEIQFLQPDETEGESQPKEELKVPLQTEPQAQPQAQPKKTKPRQPRQPKHEQPASSPTFDSAEQAPAEVREKRKYRPRQAPRVSRAAA